MLCALLRGCVRLRPLRAFTSSLQVALRFRASVSQPTEQLTVTNLLQPSAKIREGKKERRPCEDHYWKLFVALLFAIK